MSGQTLCPQCSQPVAADAAGGACLRCLVGLAVDVAAATSGPAGGRGFHPPDVEALSARFAGDELEVLALVGCGGMGAVYRARQTRLDRPVALKVLPPERGRDALFAERFLREARALAKLAHPHIVGVYDAGQVGEYLYIVMEYVEGASLRDLIRGGRLGPAEAMRLVPQVCDAMQYAHDRGVIHRDIKPENILIDETGRAKIADFGLARLSGESAPFRFTITGAQDRMGTPRYMAPEQMANTAGVDHRADIYSLGVMFYEMLTGQLPTADYKPPSDYGSAGDRVDPRVDRVVERSIKDSPDERYQKADEVKQDVERIASSPRRGWPRPVVWAAAAAAAAVITISAAALLLRGTVWRGPDPVTRAHGPTSLPGGSGVGSAAGNAKTAKPQATAPASVPLANTLTLPFATPATAAAPVKDPPPADLLTSADWQWTEPVNLGPAVNTDAYDSQASLSADGLTLVFESGRPGGKGANDLWQCRRKAVDQPWGPAKNLEAVNTAAWEADPCLSPDGLTLVFGRPPAGTEPFDLWMSRRPSPDAPWGNPVNLGEPVNSPATDGGPSFSADGSTLWFHSNRRADGVFAIWHTRRSSADAPFGAPVAAVTGCGSPCISSDGRALMFNRDWSPGPPRRMSPELFLTVRPTPQARFGEERPLTGPINSEHDEMSPCLSADGRTLIFDSTRPGGLGSRDLWMSRRVPRSGNYALEFDGHASHVSIPSLKRDELGPVTIEAWADGPLPQRPTVIFTLGGKAGGSVNASQVNWFANDPHVQGQYLDTPHNAGPTHLAYVFDGREGRFYVNGTEVDRAPAAPTRAAAEAELPHAWMGASAVPQLGGRVAYHFRGRIDETRVSRIARYRTNFTPQRRFEPDADTLALYHFDESDGDVLKDSSGHDHHGRVVGARWVAAGE